MPQKYVVTSESGEWSKTYTVEVQRNNNINLDYGFEKVRVVGALGGMCHYDEFYGLEKNRIKIEAVGLAEYRHKIALFVKPAVVLARCIRCAWSALLAECATTTSSTR